MSERDPRQGGALEASPGRELPVDGARFLQLVASLGPLGVDQAGELVEPLGFVGG